MSPLRPRDQGRPNCGASLLSEPLVDLADLRLTLGKGAVAVEVLKGATLAVEAGESVGIVGPSGSGKSTLLMVMAGLERVQSGRVRVAGADLSAMDEDQLALFRGRHVGIVFQSFHLVPNMTALENVAVPLELAGIPQAFERARTELAAVGLAQRTGHYPAEMSGGEQQRVAIARALVGRPAIVIADEPTGNLDAATGRQVADLLFAKQAERGATLVLVTHDAALARRCARMVHVSGGRIVAGPDATTEAGAAASGAAAALSATGA